MSTSNQLPPQALEIEEGLLGALMLHEEAPEMVFGQIKDARVFYKEEHRKVYRICRELHEQSRVCDMLTVAKEYEKIKKGDDNAQYFVINLTTKFTSIVTVPGWCGVVLEAYFRRELIALSAQFSQLGYDESSDAMSLLNDAQAKLDSLNTEINGDKHESWLDTLRVIQKDVEELSKADGGLVGAPTGLREVDKLKCGMKGGELIVLGARPGMGKTAMVVRWILANVAKGDAVGVMQLEMTSAQFGKRLLAIMTDYLHANHFYQHGIKNDAEADEFLRVLSEAEKFPLHVIPKPGMTVFECCVEARRLKKQHDIKLLVVDYLQLMGDGNPKRNSNRENVISEVSRKLKALSIELDIPVVALSQLSRSVETRGGSKRPQLSDLRESGSIEQDADVVMFLYRPAYYGLDMDDGRPSEGICEVLFAKHRNGSLGKCEVAFDDNRVKFHDLEDMPVGIPDQYLNDEPPY